MVPAQAVVAQWLGELHGVSATAEAASFNLDAKLMNPQSTGK